MDYLKTEGRRVNDQESTLSLGLIRIREYAQHQRIMLSDTTSFRTNHVYDRVEQARRMPSILGSVMSIRRTVHPKIIGLERLVGEDSRIKSSIS